MKQKINEKILATKLRKRGLSYNEIRRQINVSKSTLSLWLRDIALSKKQIESLEGRQKSRHKAAEAKIKKRIEQTRAILKEAELESKKFKNTTLFLTGLMLYWAEGTKYNEIISFSNSDPLMIKLMMKWFRKICKVPEEKFRIQIHVHTLYIKKDIEKYWSKITQVPLKQFNKSYIKPTSLRYRKNKLYQGTCCIRISNVNLYRKMMGWKTGVLKKLGIDFQYKIPREKNYKL